jgi:hypothetical protein
VLGMLLAITVELSPGCVQQHVVRRNLQRGNEDATWLTDMLCRTTDCEQGTRVGWCAQSCVWVMSSIEEMRIP